MSRSILDGPQPPSDPEPPRKKSKTAVRQRKGKEVASLRGDVVPLGKFLASNDKNTRDRAVAALRTFLSGGSGKAAPPDSTIFSDAALSASVSLPWTSGSSDADPRLSSAELAKLYKGLFYCFWMSDKPPVQHALADELSGLCLAVRSLGLAEAELQSGEAAMKTTRAALTFWRGFWTALMGEWSGIDKHRVDKYLMLVRKFWLAGLRTLERVRWREEAVQEWSRVVRETVLRVEDRTAPASLAYHVADIALDGLHRVLATPSISSAPVSTDDPPTFKPAPLLPLLSPFFEALADAPAGTAVFARILENVIDALLAGLAPPSPPSRKRKASTSGDEAYPLFRSRLCVTYGEGIPASPGVLSRAVVRALFETGASKDCGAIQRRKLYAAWKERGGEDGDDD